MKRITSAIFVLTTQAILFSHTASANFTGTYQRHLTDPTGTWVAASNSDVFPPLRGTTPVFGDLDGDGIDDACWVYGWPNFGFGIQCAVTELTWTDSHLIPVDESGRRVADTRWQVEGAELTPDSGPQPSSFDSFFDTMALVDVNRDGWDDLCGRAIDGIRCALSTGTRFREATLWTSDFSDRQGWAGHPSYGNTIQFVDIDGDRRVDVCGRGAAGVYCGRSTGSSFTSIGNTGVATTFSNRNGWSGDPAYYSTLMFGDIDGDADLEVCGRGYSGIWCQRYDSGQHRFEPAEQVTTQFQNAHGWSAPEYYETIQFANVNGDRFADICGRGGGGIYCMTSQGSAGRGLSTFEGGQSVLAPAFSDANGWSAEKYYSTIDLTDVNGDGLDDVCGRGGDGIYCSLHTTFLQVLFQGQTSTFSQAQLWTADFGDAQGNAGDFRSVVSADVTIDYGTEFCGITEIGLECGNH